MGVASSNTRYCAMVRLENMLKMCLIFGKSKPKYAYGLYASKKRKMYSIFYRKSLFVSNDIFLGIFKVRGRNVK